MAKSKSSTALRFLTIAFSLSAVAWAMAVFNWVYPPIPMFVAAMLTGVVLRGKPKAASQLGLAAGLIGGVPAEYAFHLTRLATGSNWLGLTVAEQLGLSAAELLLYAALLSFFGAFLSWGLSGNPEEREPSNPKPPAASRSPLDLPLFKLDQERQDRPPGPGASNRPK